MIMLNYIKCLLKDREHNRDHTNRISASNEKYWKIPDNLLFSVKESSKLSNKEVSIRDVLTEHKKNFKNVLAEIDTFDKSRLVDTSSTIREKYLYIPEADLYRKNLSTLIDVQNPQARADWITSITPELLDRGNHQKLTDFENFIQGIKELPDKVGNLESLRDYIVTHDGIKADISESLKFSRDIRLSPDYPEFIDLIICTISKLNEQGILCILNFSEKNPKLSLIMLTPCLISILGNVLFINLLMPLITSSSIKGYLYNWKQVRQDIYTRITAGHWSNIKRRILLKNQQIIAIVCTYWRLSYLLAESWFNYKPSNLIDSATRTYRDLLDNTSAGEGLEQYGIDLSKGRGVVKAVGTEAGRVVGALGSGVVTGYLDSCRPIAENLADRLDQNITKKK